MLLPMYQCGWVIGSKVCVCGGGGLLKLQLEHQGLESHGFLCRIVAISNTADNKHTFSNKH